MEVLVEDRGPVRTVIINRPEVRNAVDGATARALWQAFRDFESEETARAAVLWGAGGNFCSGADLKAVASGDLSRMNPLVGDMDDVAPLGPTRLALSKPVIAAVSGHAVAGGFELAIWCDLRVVEEDSVMGFFERRFGVPLIDGGSQRLPRLIGLSRALDLILTGRGVPAREALAFGLANRVVPRGRARSAAEELAGQLAGFPQKCMLGDRASAHAALGLDLAGGLELEFARGMETITSGETFDGASRFAGGTGRHGDFGA